MYIGWYRHRLYIGSCQIISVHAIYHAQICSSARYASPSGNFGHLNLSDPFDVKKRRSTYITEIRAGITTFLAMAYILPVNSGMLSLVIPGKREELVCATALAAFCGCWLMGILSPTTLSCLHQDGNLCCPIAALALVLGHTCFIPTGNQRQPVLILCLETKLKMIQIAFRTKWIFCDSSW